VPPRRLRDQEIFCDTIQIVSISKRSERALVRAGGARIAAGWSLVSGDVVQINQSDPNGRAACVIREAVITTVADGVAHVTPLGYRERDGLVALAPFSPSRTLDNLRTHPEAVLNFTDDVRVIAGALTGRRDWPMCPSEQVAVPRLRDTLAHWELVVDLVTEQPERPEFLCRVVHAQNHQPFLGFNRAQSAVVELAILVSRLDFLSPDKVLRESAYLRIAVDKTSGPREREAWDWLMAEIANHPRHGPTRHEESR
jgi:hypothetical protein